MNVNVIRDRAAIAHAQNKPFIIEETGMKVPFLASAPTLLICGSISSDSMVVVKTAHLSDCDRAAASSLTVHLQGQQA